MRLHPGGPRFGRGLAAGFGIMFGAGFAVWGPVRLF
jgi:hypothetical protein